MFKNTKIFTHFTNEIHVHIYAFCILCIIKHTCTYIHDYAKTHRELCRSRHKVVCRVAKDAGVSHRDYTNRKN